MQQMERDTNDQAYFLLRYSPVVLYAENRAVADRPSPTTALVLKETPVTNQPVTCLAWRRRGSRLVGAWWPVP